MLQLLKRLVVLLVLQHPLVQLDVHAQQHNDVYVWGVVNGLNKKPVKAAINVVARDTNDLSTQIVATVQKKAGYELSLPLGRVYRLDFDAPGFVQKHVIIDLLSPTVPTGDGGYGMRIDPWMFPRIDGLDYTLCLNPIAIGRYSSGPDQVLMDMQYTESIRPAMLRLAEACEAAIRIQKRK